MDEVFQLVRREIAKSGYEEWLASGVVMTGGGMMLPGAIEMAEQTFGIPTRIGTPKQIDGLVDIISSPIYAAGVGLVIYGLKRQEHVFWRGRDGTILSRVKHRMSDWLSEFF